MVSEMVLRSAAKASAASAVFSQWTLYHSPSTAAVNEHDPRIKEHCRLLMYRLNLALRRLYSSQVPGLTALLPLPVR